MKEPHRILIALVMVITISAACARDEEAYAPTPVGTGPVALVFDGEGIWVASKNRTLSRLRLSSE